MVEGDNMICQKCNHKNKSDAKFCSACGTELDDQRVQSAVPVWMWIVLIISCITIGGVGYGFWDYYHEEKAVTKEEPYNEISNAPEQVVEQDSIPEKQERQEQYAKEVDLVSLIKEVQPKVFTVLTTDRQGSGFLYKKGGYAITNAHVIDGEVEVTVRNANGQEFAATVIGISEKYDIALLHIPDYQNEEPLEGEGAESLTGLKVVAFGSPQGFENSASVGYITGEDRDMEAGRFTYKQIYQIDAQIDQGSSGGPLVDANTGKVIGINSLLYTSETNTNFGFSIPLYSMMDQVEAWIAQPMSRDKVLAVAGVYEDYNDSLYEEPNDIDVDAALAGQFVQSFRMYYELALNESNFSWISDMLAPGSRAYQELEEYVADISYEGHQFYFISNDVLDVTYENGKYLVYMNETFDFYSGTGDYQFYDRYKTYTVIIDEDGAFKISSIQIHE